MTPWCSGRVQEPELRGPLEGQGREEVDQELGNSRREQTLAMRLEGEKPARELDLSAVARI